MRLLLLATIVFYLLASIAISCSILLLFVNNISSLLLGISGWIMILIGDSFLNDLLDLIDKGP